MNFSSGSLKERILFTVSFVSLPCLNRQLFANEDETAKANSDPAASDNKESELHL